MEERGQELRRCIRLYRDLLRQGPSLKQAARYLRQIEDAEAELERISDPQPQSHVSFR